MANSAHALRSSEVWTPAKNLQVLREEQPFPPLEVPELKAVFSKGIKRGRITAIYGDRSSGRTSICLHVLAQATARGEICAVVDLYNSFHPGSATAAGVRLDHLVWIRCSGNIEYAIRANDLLVHAGGFGVIVLDLCEAQRRVLNRIPFSYWFRFRRAIEHTPAVLLVCAGSHFTSVGSSFYLQTKLKGINWSGREPFCLLRGLEIYAILDKVSALHAHELFLKTAV